MNYRAYFRALWLLLRAVFSGAEFIVSAQKIGEEHSQTVLFGRDEWLASRVMDVTKSAQIEHKIRWKLNQIAPPVPNDARPADLPRVTLTDAELIERCEAWVTILCESAGRKWTLSVPPNFKADPDLLFSELIWRFRSRQTS